MRLTIGKSRVALLVCVGLLLAIWLTRLIGIDHFPPFIDETIHIHGGELTRRVSLFNDGQIGRQGTFWWMMLFQAYRGSPIWVARAITVLALLPGLAALMGSARLLAGYWGAVVFGLLFLFSNYHMFFARLALADPLAGSAVMIAIYFATRLVRRRHWLDAVAVGIFLTIGFIAKVNVIPFFGIPIAAALCLHPSGKVDVRRQAIWLGIALGSGLILTMLFVFGMRLFGQDVLTRSLFLAISGEGITAKNNLIDVTRILINIRWTFNLVSSYLGSVILFILLFTVVISIVRRQFFVVLCLFGPFLAIWSSVTQESRFLVLPLAILFLTGAIFAGTVLRKGNRLVQVAVVGLIVIYGTVQWLPFTIIANNDPNGLPLPMIDMQQYIQSTAAGTGFPETIAFLQSVHVNEVIGLAMNCQGFRYLALNEHEAYKVDCPTVNLNGTNIQDLANIVKANRRDGVFVITENADYVPQNIPGQLLTVIDRPSNGAKIYVYQLSAP